MSNCMIPYLKLLQYPLKLENIIINYFPLCGNKITDYYHKSLLLYLICTGYPFENILSDEIDLQNRLFGGVLTICNGNEFHNITINHPDIYFPIAQKYHMYHLTFCNQTGCFGIDKNCIQNIYDIAENTLYNISKELLYKHFLIYSNDDVPLDVIKYIMNLSLILLK